MDLNVVFSNAVDNIFKQFDSIAVDVEFTEILASGFNFSTGKPDVTTTVVNVRGIPLAEESNGSTTAPSNRTRLIVKSGSVNPSYYSRITFNSNDYNIVEYKDNGFIITFELVKDR